MFSFYHGLPLTIVFAIVALSWASFLSVIFSSDRACTGFRLKSSLRLLFFRLLLIDRISELRLNGLLYK